MAAVCVPALGFGKPECLGWIKCRGPRGGAPIYMAFHARIIARRLLFRFIDNSRADSGKINALDAANRAVGAGKSDRNALLTSYRSLIFCLLLCSGLK